MYCKMCGQQINEGEQFCPHCGCRVDQVRFEADQTRPMEPIDSDADLTQKMPRVAPQQSASGQRVAGQQAPGQRAARHAAGQQAPRQRAPQRAAGQQAPRQRAPQQNAPQQNAPHRDAHPQKQAGKKKSKLPWILGAVALVLVILLGIAAFFLLRGNRSQGTINLTKYYTISFTGTDGEGNAYGYLDVEKLREDYGDKLELNEDLVRKLEKKDPDVFDEIGLTNADVVIGLGIDSIGALYKAEILPGDYLKNDDTVTLRWNVEQVAADNQLFNYELTYNECEVTVVGLEAPEEASAGSNTETQPEQKPEEQEPEENAEEKQYLCKEASERALTQADLQEIRSRGYDPLPDGRSLEQMIINELYARHGYRFKNEKIQAYFNEKDWYQSIGSYNSDMDSVLRSMSSVERANVEFLSKLTN